MGLRIGNQTVSEFFGPNATRKGDEVDAAEFLNFLLGQPADEKLVREDEDTSDEIPDMGKPDFNIPDPNQFIMPGMGRSKDPIETLLRDNKISFERDAPLQTEEEKRKEEEARQRAEEQGLPYVLPTLPQPVREAVDELYKNDPEFKAAFDEAIENGLQIMFRYQAPETGSSIINNDILLVDIENGADVKAELKKIFNDDSDLKPATPGEGPSLEEVLADEGLSGADYVGHLERLGIFSFSGPAGGKIRKDVIAMIEKSPSMRAMIELNINLHNGEKAYNFSALGEGGGTSFHGLGENIRFTVNAPGAYAEASVEDYDPAENWGNVHLMAHEMMHTFLDIPDEAVIRVAGDIFNREYLGDAFSYDDMEVHGEEAGETGFVLSDTFDKTAFMEAALKGELHDLSLEEIMDRFGGGAVIEKERIESREQYEEELKSLVEDVRASVNGRDIAYMEGPLAERYSRLLDYNMRTGNFDSWKAAGDDTKQQFVDRIGNFEHEADVFNGYLKRQGGNEQLDSLAYNQWHDVMNPGHSALRDGKAFDEKLGWLVSTIESNVEGRMTLYMEGALAETFKELLAYNLRSGGFDSFEELSDHTRDQLMYRLGEFEHEADVFQRYLDAHGGNETLDKLAEEVWVDAGFEPGKDPGETPAWAA